MAVEGPADIAALVRHVPDFPQVGVGFKDISPLLESPSGYAAAIAALAAVSPPDIDVVLGIEARGFLVGAPVALALGVGFVPVRKPGKLPGETFSASYDLEYGSNTLAVHRDAVAAGARALVVDDVLATGGTVLATGALLEQLGAELVQVTVLIELEFLRGRERLHDAGLDRVQSILRYDQP